MSLLAKLKHTLVYSAGVFLQNATFRLNLCVYVLDYPPKLDLRQNVREVERLEHFERERLL